MIQGIMHKQNGQGRKEELETIQKTDTAVETVALKKKNMFSARIE